MELGAALAEAQKRTGCHLSILGMDTCLGGCVEAAYQLHELADYMVSSQEIEQAGDWPYEQILCKLSSNPEMPPKELSKIIVQEYGQYYGSMYRDGGGAKTQSAYDLSKLPTTFDRLKGLSELFRQTLETDRLVKSAFCMARGQAKRFRDPDSVDLKQLAGLMRDEYIGDGPLSTLADELDKHLVLGETDSPIIANFSGPQRSWANGISIYFPADNYSPYYDRLNFARSGWNLVLRQVKSVDAT